MKTQKKLLIGVVAMLVLLAVFFATRKTATDADLLTAITLDAMPDLAKITIVMPKDAPADAGETITLERRGGEWWMIAPHESPMAEDAVRQLGDRFDRPVRADDLTFGEDQADALGVSDAKATRVSFTRAGQDKPALELLLGQSLTLPNTRAQRTYARLPGDPRIYRLQASLDVLTPDSVNALRSKTLLKLDEASITQLTLTHRDQAPMVLRREGEAWVMAQPEPNMKLEEAALAALTASLRQLRVNELTDALKPQDAGLVPPEVTIEVKTADETITLELGSVIKRAEANEDAPDGAPEAEQDARASGEVQYYVRRTDRGGAYPIALYTGQQLSPDLARLRHAIPRALEREKITGYRYEHPEQGTIALTRLGDAWQVSASRVAAHAQPLPVTAPVQLDALLGFVSQVRVGRYARPGEQTGLEQPDASTEAIVIEAQDGEVKLYLGEPVPDAPDGRFGRFSETPHAFVVSKHMLKQLRPPIESLIPPPPATAPDATQGLEPPQ